MRLGQKAKKKARPVFASIRKPVPPPTIRMGQEKPEEKLHPAGRKVKHKGNFAVEIEE